MMKSPHGWFRMVFQPRRAASLSHLGKPQVVWQWTVLLSCPALPLRPSLHGCHLKTESYRPTHILLPFAVNVTIGLTVHETFNREIQNAHIWSCQFCESCSKYPYEHSDSREVVPVGLWWFQPGQDNCQLLEGFHDCQSKWEAVSHKQFLMWDGNVKVCLFFSDRSSIALELMNQALVTEASAVGHTPLNHQQHK